MASQTVAAEQLERELEIDETNVLYIADNVTLADEAGATTWDCGLVVAHYLIKQHEMGEVCFVLVVERSAHACTRSPSLPHNLLPPLHWWVLLAGTSVVKGRRVLELGAGTGVVGLTAAALGAKQVVLTDKEHLVPLLQRNIEVCGRGVVEMQRADSITGLALAALRTRTASALLRPMSNAPPCSLACLPLSNPHFHPCISTHTEEQPAALRTGSSPRLGSAPAARPAASI